MLLLWEYVQLQGGMFGTNSYSTVRGVDKLIPIDMSICQAVHLNRKQL